MFGRELPVTTVDEALRLIRALGKHRYVASRGIHVHALIAALGGESDLSRWARDVLGNPDIDPASRDERLMHQASEDELAELLGGFWGVDPTRREKLRAALDNLELPVSEGAPFAAPSRPSASPSSSRARASRKRAPFRPPPRFRSSPPSEPSSCCVAPRGAC